MTLETQTCGRCGGSGSYSYCSGYGTTCFKCHGRKVVFSKRGAAANDFLIRLRQRFTHEITPGMLVFSQGFSCGSVSQGSKFHKVTGVSEPAVCSRSLRNGVWEDNIGVTIECEGWSLGTGTDTLHRVGHTKLGKEKTFALALEYQAKLTKTGKLKAGEAEVTAEGLLRVTDTSGWLVGGSPEPRGGAFIVDEPTALRMAVSALSSGAWIDGGYVTTGA